MTDNCVWQDFTINKKARSLLRGQKSCVIWFTGLSGAGKSTLAAILEKKLYDRGYATYLLDGDNLRHGLCADLGFSELDRVENIRRAGEVAKLFVDAGIIVIASFISPFQRERSMVRSMVDPGEFVEVYVSTPLSVCEERDPKGLYNKARMGQIRNFTGIDSPYEIPVSPEICIDTSCQGVESSISNILLWLESSNIINKN